MNSPRKSYADSPNMTWLSTFSIDWIYRKCCVPLFRHLDLKMIKRKLQFIIFMYLLMKFQSDAQRECYDDFPKVIYLGCNVGDYENPNILGSSIRKYRTKWSEIRSQGSSGFSIKWVLILCSEMSYEKSYRENSVIASLE